MTSQIVGLGLALCVAWHVFNFHDAYTSALVVITYAFGVCKGVELCGWKFGGTE